MPYAVVETIDALGNKELLAAPESWLQSRENGKQYLCWPNVRNITTLNAFLLDETSVPSLMWEKHECTIKRRSIISFALASKTLEGIQKLSENKTSTPRITPTKSPDINLLRNIVDQEKLDSNQRQEDLLEPTNDLPFDPLGDARMTPKVSQMFNELKRQIDTNQEEMTKKMNEGFYRIQKALLTLMHKHPEKGDTMVKSSANAVPGTASKQHESFSMNPMKTVEEMNDFEKRLKDDRYRKQVLSWIDSVVSYERDPECRMMEILDLLFDRHLLPNFSWTGASSKGVKKHAFGEYRSIVQLFCYAGTTDMHRADNTFVAHFFMKKLRHAPLRAATLQGLRRCVPHSSTPRFSTRKKAVRNINDLENSTKYVTISRADFGSLIKTEDSDESNTVQQAEFEVGSVRSLGDHQYTEYSILEIDNANDLQPTLFMSAEDETE